MSASTHDPNFPKKGTRRKFIGGVAATAGIMLIKPQLARGTAANSAVRVGLLGCGGRGTEDASNLVDTGGARVVALADLFQDQLDKAHAHFDQMQQGKGYSQIDASQLFLGPDAYHKIAASKEIDAIVVATPPYYHPQHLEAVVAGLTRSRRRAKCVARRAPPSQLGPRSRSFRRHHRGAKYSRDRHLQLDPQVSSLESFRHRWPPGTPRERWRRLRKLQRYLSLSRQC